MRYIHGKDWDAKMLEALVAESMKPKIHEAIPDIQIGGKAGHSSIEHLVLIKTWMLNMEVNNGSGIFQCFDMEKFFDKESLIDTLNALYVQGDISDKDYRMWFKLNCKTRISVVTSVGETDAARIFDSIGQCSFGAALASSLNIGTAIYDATEGETLTELGHMPLNCLIFQDDIARLNTTLEQARRGATLIGDTLAKKKLKSNLTKSRYVLLGSAEFKERTRQEARENPVMMGSHIMEESSEEKYLGDMIHTDGLDASILSTVNKRLGVLISKNKCYHESG